MIERSREHPVQYRRAVLATRHALVLLALGLVGPPRARGHPAEKTPQKILT